MTEDQIERRVEKMTDHLDHLFTSGAMARKEYDHAIRELDEWASAQYARAKFSRSADRVDGYDRDDLGCSHD